MYEQIPELNEKNIEVGFIGSKSGLDPDYLADITNLAAMTKGNTGMRVNIASTMGTIRDRGGIKRLAKEGPEAIDKLTPEGFADYLYTAGQPEPDLIIRTSGEMRISNFLIWQSAYSEIYFTDTLWPDFGKAEMLKAILDFQQRTRRWGGL